MKEPIFIYQVSQEDKPPPLPYYFWNGLGWNYIDNGWVTVLPVPSQGE